MTTPDRSDPGDPRAPGVPLVRRCWFCQRPEPNGVRKLGGGSQGFTQIPVCADGEGCNDDTVRHGPPYAPHRPGEDCRVCGTGPQVAAIRRNAVAAVPLPAPPGRNRRKPR